MHDSAYRKNLGQAASRRQEVEQRLPGAGGSRTGELLVNRCRAAAWDDGKVLKTGGVSAECHWVVH